MDALEVLNQYGRVEPAERSTIDAAAAAVLTATDAGGPRRFGRPRRSARPRAVWPRRTLVVAGSVAAATAIAVAGVATTAGPHRSPSTHVATGAASATTHHATRTVPTPGPAHHPAVAHGDVAHGGKAVLSRLADSVLKSPAEAGNATLVLRSQTDGKGAPIPGADLYADNGRYYYAHTESGLPAQVKAGHSQGGGVFGREVAAAKEAVTGNLDSAIQAMEDAPDPTLKTTGINADWLWEDSLDALMAGAGNPTVRAGVLNLVASLHQVSVANATVNGTSALQLTAHFPNESKCAANHIKPTTARMKKICASLVGGGFWEQINLDATTGIPLSFAGGAPGQPASYHITYQVSRVTLADVAAGHFTASSPSTTAGA
ncbi:MAG TPA: hypothetical protein VKV06_04340 [Acidimicrobiales bacterium]|nr:hypothetical protein [Acidimicrobiales bacterium]